MSHIELNRISKSETALDVEPSETDIENRPNRSNFRRYLQTTKTVWKNHNQILKVALLTLFCYAWSIVGIVHRGMDKAAGLFGIALFLSFCIIYKAVRDHYGEAIYYCAMAPVVNGVKSKWRYLQWVVYAVIGALIIIWLAVDTRKDPRRFISLAGLLVFILIAYVFSKHRSQVQWRPVLWGIALQFIFALFILRTNVGLSIFKFLGDQIEHFLLYTDVGSSFVFGESFTMHYFAFKVIPVVIFFSSIVSVLYHLEIMQMVIIKVSWLMQRTMGTSGAESLNSAGNIFVGMTESPLMIRPFIERMTVSEIHSVMTSGFATIAGSVLAAYISFGVPASHLLSASIMSAPAALAISKLLYPETEEPETAGKEDIVMEKSTENNFIEAAASGASNAIPLAANIAVNLIAFLAMLAFVDGVLFYLGDLVGIPELSFKLICSYVLRPIAFIMGVDWEDTPVVAELIGTKTFLNEFVAYLQLAEYVKRRTSGAAGVILTPRTEIITTYALCGFANIGSVGILLGGLSAMAPSRRGDMAKVAVRSLIAGTLACFMTACIAGVLYQVE